MTSCFDLMKAMAYQSPSFCSSPRPLNFFSSCSLSPMGLYLRHGTIAIKRKNARRTIARIPNTKNSIHEIIKNCSTITFWTKLHLANKGSKSPVTLICFKLHLATWGNKVASGSDRFSTSML